VVHLDDAAFAGRGGALVAPAVLAARPFARLLVSWNVDVARGAGFRVEVRVSPDASGDAWSPWLFLGDWGRRPDGESEPTVAFDEGRVAIDELVLERPHGRAEVRLVPFPADVPRAVAPRRLTLCFTAPGDGVAEAATRVAAPPAQAPLLSVPARSQHDADPALATRICSPTSLAMVLAYHGVELPTVEVASLAYDVRHDLYGNWPRAIQTAYRLGVPGYLVRLDDLDSLAGLVGAGSPVVCSIAVEEGALTGAPYASTPGHLLVVVGFEANGDVVVNDPAAPEVDTVRRTYDRAEFARAWLGHGGVAYVFEPLPAAR
jgi:hypothetical protein